MLFQSKRPHFEHLKKKWTAKHRQLQNSLWTNHGEAINQFAKSFPKHLAAGSLGGLLLLSAPGNLAVPMELTNSDRNLTKGFDENVLLASKLQPQLPSEMRALTPEEESKIADILSENFGFKVTPEINNIRLNRSYGMIGGEQHLYRYPGDNLYKHADTTAESAMYIPSGIAPGLGAWGYFAPSEAEFSEKDKQREKYYIAVQTFLAPGFAENVKEYRDFFKFRKMILVNPKTGQAVVAVIGDAGPAEWTGKHLGGSPEVMHYLGVAGGPRKGAVLYFFIDDPKDEVLLGPI